jgi:hypothetical protein
MGAAAGDYDLDGHLDIFNRHTSRMWTLMVAFHLCLSALSGQRGPGQRNISRRTRASTGAL